MFMSIARKILVPGLIVAGLTGGAYYLSQRPAQGAHSLRNLAAETPKQTFFWMAAEARDHFQFEQLATQIQEMRGSFPDINESLTQMEKTSGKSVEEILKIYGSSGYIALLSLPERSDLMPVGDEFPLDLVVSIQVRDPAAARDLLKKSHGDRAPKAETFESFEIIVDAEKSAYCVTPTALILASGREPLQRTLKVKKGDSLAQEAVFQDALKHIPALADSNGAMAYCNLAPCWNTLEKAGSAYVDAETMQGVRALPYFVGGFYRSRGHWQLEAFLRVEGQSKSALAKALLKKPQTPPQLANLVPQDWGYFQSLELFYTFDTVLEIARLVPLGRVGSNMGLARLGLNQGSPLRQKIHNSLSGEIAWGFQMIGLEKPEQGVLGGLLLGLKDAKVTQNLLDEALRKAGKNAQTITIEGKQGYSVLSEGQEVCWVVVEQPPALAISAGTKAQESLQQVLQCAGGKLPSVARQSAFKAFLDQHGQGAVSQHFLNLQPLLDILKTRAPELKIQQQMEKLKLDPMPVDLASLQIEEQGLRFTNQGAVGTIGFLGGGLSAILVPNFVKARGQGQLTACKSNQSNLATGLEMWSADNQGRYPKEMSQLTPEYLKQIPTCPAAQADTYSQSYQVSSQPDLYTFYCQGHHHKPQVPANFPQYNAMQGLIERP